MTEQTEMVVDEWIYIPPATEVPADKIKSNIELEVMRKDAPTKKGLACRFTCRFLHGEEALLLYVAQDSYVIDLDDKIEPIEVHRMIRNSFSKFNEKYEFRKLGTVLQNIPLPVFDERTLDINDIVHFLN
jgi:hypothetical protein